MRIILNDLMLAFSTALDYVEISLIGATNGHSRRVAALSCKLAESFGISDEQRFYLTVAAALHDNALTEFICEELRPAITEDGQIDAYVERNLGRHCVMGERNVSGLSFYSEIKDAILYHHERADGNGPFGKKPEEIPTFARIIHFADIMDVSYQFGDMNQEKYEKINRFLDERGRKVFDDEMIAAFRRISYDDLAACKWNDMLGTIPLIKKDYSSKEIEGMAQFFAKIIDYKSPFTCSHSMGIAEKARKISQFYGWDEAAQDEMYLDGSGYPFHKKAEEMGFKERVMMVLDIYQALTEPRPYKEGMSHEKSMSIIYGMVEQGKLDGQAAEDVDQCFGVSGE